MVVLDRLIAICGSRFVRPAGPADTVGAVSATWVVTPASADEVAGVVGAAADEGLAVVARGSGSKLDWGPPPARLDLIVDLARLTGVHRPTGRADGGTGSRVPVATVDAGTPLRSAAAELALAGRRIPLDPASPGATAGGALSSDEGGPLRLRHGPPRDLLTGVAVVRADGVLVRSAGRLGHSLGDDDLGSVSCGSFGTLGVITSATFRLEPLPAARAWAAQPVRTPREVRDLTVAVLGGGLEPAAIEMDLPAAGPGTIAVLFEGAPPAVLVRARAAVTLLGGPATVAGEAPHWWGRYPFGPGDVALKLAAPVAGLHTAIYALRDGAGVPVPMRGSPGIGEAFVALPGDLPPARAEAALAAVRTALVDRGGSCTVLAAPPPLRSVLDLWGDVPGATEAWRLKRRFDPTGILAPGRSIGGL